jgi:hypothetical protein
MRDYKAQWLVLKAAVREEIQNATLRTAQGTKETFDHNQGQLHGLEWALASLLTIEEADALPDLEGDTYGTGTTDSRDAGLDLTGTVGGGAATTHER